MVCFFCSGFLSLAYEICWIRKASLVFGATSLAMSTVLGVFFMGLAIGSYLSGRYSRRVAQPLVGYVIIEIAVGIAAIANPSAFMAADRIFGWLYPYVFDHFWAICGVRLVLVAAILLPPTVLIGSTLPLFCRYFVRSTDNVQRSVGLLYGVNTFGAAIGCAASGFVLLPQWGADATLYYGGLCSLVVGALHGWPLDGITPPIGVAVTRPNVLSVVYTTHPQKAPGSTLSSLFFLSGFVALGHEVV